MRGFFGFHSLLKSRDSSVGTVTRLGAGVSGVRTLAEGKRFFFSPNRPDRPWGSTSLLHNGYRGTLHSGLQRPEREADHSPPYSAEVKNKYSYNSTPLHVFMAYARANATFLLESENL